MLLVIALAAASPAFAQTGRIPRVTLKAPDYQMRKPAAITLTHTPLRWNHVAARQEEDEGGWRRVQDLRTAYTNYEEGWGAYESGDVRTAASLWRAGLVLVVDQTNEPIRNVLVEAYAVTRPDVEDADTVYQKAPADAAVDVLAVYADQALATSRVARASEAYKRLFESAPADPRRCTWARAYVEQTLVIGRLAERRAALEWIAQTACVNEARPLVSAMARLADLESPKSTAEATELPRVLYRLYVTQFPDADDAPAMRYLGAIYEANRRAPDWEALALTFDELVALRAKNKQQFARVAATIAAWTTTSAKQLPVDVSRAAAIAWKNALGLDDSAEITAPELPGEKTPLSPREAAAARAFTAFGDLAKKTDPDAATFRWLAARLYLAHGRVAEARPLLKWISKHAPDHLSADAARETLEKTR
jgi:tetratricopeptide (TPR) repeat protein